MNFFAKYSRKWFAEASQPSVLLFILMFGAISTGDPEEEADNGTATDN